MAEMLSQAEIDALLGGSGDSTKGNDSTPERADVIQGSIALQDYEEHDGILTTEQKDILGEVGNISMGTAATTLSALLNHRVNITTPVVRLITWEQLSSAYKRPCVGVRIDYTVGLKGTNILILVNKDVKIITDLMMGGSGENIDDDAMLSELDLSAIGEAMNQMIGSSSTSLASMMNEKIDIATPQSFQLDFSDVDVFDKLVRSKMDERVVAISFNMQVDDLIDSIIVQALPIEFAQQMAAKMKAELMGGADEPAPTQTPPPPQQQAYAPPPQQAYAPQPQQAYAPQPQQAYPPQQAYAPQPQQAYPPPQYAPYPPPYAAYPPPQQAYAPQPQKIMPEVNAQAVQFQNFNFETAMQQKENIDILMDVPLEVTVELGKTSKRIKEILEFSPGTIIELDKLAGEPIDILVNGKYVARGEVVVIEENFAIRVTGINANEMRL